MLNTSKLRTQFYELLSEETPESLQKWIIEDELRLVKQIKESDWRQLVKNQKIPNKSLFYPKAKKWMWNYCLYVGSYEYDHIQTIDGKEVIIHRKYDLGIFIYFSDKYPNRASAAHVYGNKEGEYQSGEYDLWKLEQYQKDDYFQQYKKGWKLFIEKLKNLT